MEALLILGVLTSIGYALYRSGKRVGSRKGYHVGFSRGRRRRRSPSESGEPVGLPAPDLGRMRTANWLSRPTAASPRPFLLPIPAPVLPRRAAALGAGQLELLSTSCIWQQFAPDALSSGEHRCSRPAQAETPVGGRCPPKGRAAGGFGLMPRQAARFEESRARRAHWIDKNCVRP